MDIDKIVSIVARVSMARLSSCLGVDRLNRLAALGIPMTAHSIANAAFQEQGFDLFKNKTLRFLILNSLSPQQRNEIYKDFPSSSDLESLANFNWGRNKSTEQFLKIFNVKINDVFIREGIDNSYRTNVKVENPLFDYQNNIRRQLHKFLQNDTQRKVVAHMPTGTGKTRTTIEVICDFMRNKVSGSQYVVVWMAHSDELCEQAVQSFRKIWQRIGSEDADVYRLWGRRKSEIIEARNPSFVVTSFQSFYSAWKSKDDLQFKLVNYLSRKCDLLIVDEAHMSTAPTYSTVIKHLCNEKTKLIGLTATPGRHHIDGDTLETQKLAKFYDENKITIDTSITENINPVEYLQGRAILSKIDRARLESGVDIRLSSQSLTAISTFLEIPKEILSELGNNTKRTSEVAAATFDLAVSKRKQTIVFCPTKENSVEMAILLQSKGCKARAITSDTPFYERRKWIEEFKRGEVNVLTNFGVLTTGFDAPKIEAVVIARPTTSIVLYSQMVGRGLRGAYVGGTEYCTVVDVIDNIINMPRVSHAFTFFDKYFGISS